MGLESSTYINGLTQAWPIAGDPKSQGDDHIRLVKTVLQNTFPGATKPFIFPSAAVISVGGALGAVAHQNADIYLNTAGGAFTLSLPALGVGDGGWRATIIKYTTDGNYVNVVPTSGTITSQAGATPLIRIGQVCKAATFMWSGGSWFCTKDGGLIGETVNFDGATVPPGYLVLNGVAFDGASFCELAAMIGTTTLRDKRGRVDVGVDEFGFFAGIMGSTLGSVGGTPSHTLTAAQMPVHRHSAAIYDPTHAHPNISASTVQNIFNTGTAPNPCTYDVATSIAIGAAATGVRINSDGGLDTTYTAGGGASHPIVQPTIVSQKLIRAC